MENETVSASAGVSNTPAVNTGENGLSACLDWVSCSFSIATDMQQIFILIGIDDLSTLEIKKGARYEFAGYDKTYLIGKIELMHYKCDEGMDHWFLNMSGQACRQFEISSRIDFVTLFALLINLDAVFTRIDGAIDDVKGFYSVDKFRNAVYKEQCVTKLRTWGNHQRGLIATGNRDITMDSFYLGSRDSRYFINVYDKRKEQIARGLEVADLPDFWVRTEIRFSYEYADLFVIHLVNNKEPVGHHLKSFLNDKVVFLKPTSMLVDSNRSRLAKDITNHARWWRSFLNGAGKLHLSTYAPDKTLAESREWLEKQVSTTLAMLHMYDAENYHELIKELTILGLDKMKKKHERKVLNQHYLDKFSERKRKNAHLFNDKEIDIG